MFQKDTLKVMPRIYFLKAAKYTRSTTISFDRDVFSKKKENKALLLQPGHWPNE